VTIDDLYPLVTDAILRADVLEDLGAPGAAQAQRDVSRLEEQVAELLPASDPEGAIARRGAVRAAGKANDYARVQSLAERYLAEPDAGPELRDQIAALLAENEDPMGAHHRRAVSRLGVDRLRGFAHLLAGQGSPLPIG
jgi:F420-dependent methylenetetrahydromethanopterin dehydrogenase